MSTGSLTHWVLVVAAMPLLGLAAYWGHAALTHPLINDITTDSDDPPVFAAMPRIAPYPGASFAQRQREAYPDLAPLRLSEPPGEVHARALALMRARGWTVEANDPASLHIEAIARSRIFRFTDEIVLRLAPEGDGTRVDMRSRSRVGRGDLGVNAARIRAFFGDLAAGGRAGAA